MTAFASRADKWHQSKLGPAKRQTYRDRKRVSNTRKELGKPYRMLDYLSTGNGAGCPPRVRKC